MVVAKQIILNSSAPICKACKYFMPSTIKCSFFGSKCLVTGNITYENAWSCRIREDQCGTNGTRYEYYDNQSEPYHPLHYVFTIPIFFATCWIGGYKSANYFFES